MSAVIKYALLAMILPAMVLGMYAVSSTKEEKMRYHADVCASELRQQPTISFTRWNILLKGYMAVEKQVSGKMPPKDIIAITEACLRQIVKLKPDSMHMTAGQDVLAGKNTHAVTACVHRVAGLRVSSDRFLSENTVLDAWNTMEKYLSVADKIENKLPRLAGRCLGYVADIELGLQ